jgi:hypothetical protein
MAFTGRTFKTYGTEASGIAGFNVFPAKELVEMLVVRGYRYCKPKATTWQSGLLLNHKGAVLCVLFRKSGVDLRYYSHYNGEITIGSDNIASFSGGDLYRNHYKKSFQIHRRIWDVAMKFASGNLSISDIPGKMTRSQFPVGSAFGHSPQEQGLADRALF